MVLSLLFANYVKIFMIPTNICHFHRNGITITFIKNEYIFLILQMQNNKKIQIFIYTQYTYLLIDK